MDFLKQLALPQSAAQIEVLHFVMSFVQILFVPFASYLFGAIILSLFYGRKGRIHNDADSLRFAKDIVENILPNKSIVFLFGIIPYLAIVFAYAQLLQGTDAISIGVLTWGLLFFVAGVVFAASYNSAFKLSSVLESVKPSSEEVVSFQSEASEQRRTSGKYAVLFLFLGMLFFYAGTTLAANPPEWEDVSTVIQLFFSLDVLLRFLHFIVLSFAVASLGTLFFIFSWEGGEKHVSDEYAAYVKKILPPIALLAILIQPLFIVGSIVLVPASGLSGMVFMASVSAIVFLFLASHYVYAMMKEFESKYAALAFYALLFVIGSSVIADTGTFSTATQKHSSLLAFEFEKYHEELLSRMGISLKVVTGEEIFTAKCSACHEFGAKKVGPAYKDVLPKYENDRAALVAFVSNPVKKDPAFPPMPNQGLKPVEVDSIAAYIMKMYKQSK